MPSVCRVTAHVQTSASLGQKAPLTVGALPVQSHVVGGWARGSVQGGASHVQGSGTPSHGASRTLTLSRSPSEIPQIPGEEIKEKSMANHNGHVGWAEFPVTASLCSTISQAGHRFVSP